MGKLGKWADKNRTYVKLADGETISALYLGYKIIPSRLDPEKETVQYDLEIGGDSKTFESRSLALADVFDGIEEGSLVKITRNGLGNKTKYTVEPYDIEPGSDGVPHPAEAGEEKKPGGGKK